MVLHVVRSSQTSSVLVSMWNVSQTDGRVLAHSSSPFEHLSGAARVGGRLRNVEVRGEPRGYGLYNV